MIRRVLPGVGAGARLGVIAALSICVLDVALIGCSRPAPPASTPSGSDSAPVSFVNKVWRVRASTAVEPGTIYVFVSDGTLLITSPHGTPALGSWTHENGVFTMIEEGRSYPTEILGLSRDELRIRSHNPGPPVEITLVPAEAPLSP